MTLTPAYGRDYSSAEAVIKDYLAGKDFILNDVTSQWHGKPCSCRDFPNQRIELRYRKLRRVTTAIYVPPKEDKKPEPVTVYNPELIWDMLWSPRPLFGHKLK